MFFLIFAAVALALTFAPPRVRKIGLALVGVVFIVFLATVLINRQPLPADHPVTAAPKNSAPAESRRFDFDQYQRDKKDKADPEAKTRIPTSEVRFDQVNAVAGIETGTIQSIRARFYNDSGHFTLTDYSYYLVVQDCLPAATNEKTGDHCTTVYDQRDWVTLEVPANQARDVVIVIPRDSSFHLPFKLLGKPRVELTATDVRAYQSVGPTP
jgi:hypothetical protein